MSLTTQFATPNKCMWSVRYSYYQTEFSPLKEKWEFLIKWNYKLWNNVLKQTGQDYLISNWGEEWWEQQNAL